MNISDHNEGNTEPARTISRRALLGGMAAGGVAAALGAVAGPAPAAARFRSGAHARAASLTKPWDELDASRTPSSPAPDSLDKGYYTKAGLDVTVIPGGPTTAPIAVVESGTALVTIATR